MRKDTKVLASVGRALRKETLFKGLPGIIFNVFFTAPDCSGTVLGIRLCNGRLYPPSGRSQRGSFYNTVMLSESIAIAIFRAASASFDKKWPELFTREEQDAIRPLWDKNDDFARKFVFESAIDAEAEVVVATANSALEEYISEKGI